MTTKSRAPISIAFSLDGCLHSRTYASRQIATRQLQVCERIIAMPDESLPAGVKAISAAEHEALKAALHLTDE